MMIDLDTNEQTQQRKEKLKELRKKGLVYPNDFARNAVAKTLHEKFDQLDEETLAKEKDQIKVAGRIMFRRLMGKASFVNIQDMSGRIQLYIAQDQLPE